MTKIVVVGWNKGFNKISFTRVLMKKLGIGLMDSRSITHSVVAGDPVIFHISGETLATAFINSIKESGAVVTVD